MQGVRNIIKIPVITSLWASVVAGEEVGLLSNSWSLHAMGHVTEE